MGGEHNHADLVDSLIKNSVEMKPGVDPDGKVLPVTYPNEAEMYPTVGDLQGLDGDAATQNLADALDNLDVNHNLNNSYVRERSTTTACKLCW